MTQLGKPISSRRIKGHPERLIDIAVLFAIPAVFMLISNGLEFGQAWTILAGLMLLGYGAIFYFFREPADLQDHSHSSTVGLKTPWLDYAALLSLPVAVIAGLLYLVWTHTVLGKLGLAVATLAIPLAVVLLSWFVLKHQAHQVKKTGLRPYSSLIWGLLAFWISAVFIFALCLVSWIQKFVL